MSPQFVCLVFLEIQKPHKNSAFLLSRKLPGNSGWGVGFVSVSWWSSDRLPDCPSPAWLALRRWTWWRRWRSCRRGQSFCTRSKTRSRRPRWQGRGSRNLRGSRGNAANWSPYPTQWGRSICKNKDRFITLRTRINYKQFFPYTQYDLLESSVFFQYWL